MSAPLAKVAVISRLPHWRCQEEGADLPRDIVGSRIIGFGAAPVEAGIEGGGLIIDYVPDGSDDVRRIVLAFNELGMWVAHPKQP
jgi:hypothetical protein